MSSSKFDLYQKYSFLIFLFVKVHRLPLVTGLIIWICWWTKPCSWKLVWCVLFYQLIIFFKLQYSKSSVLLQPWTHLWLQSHKRSPCQGCRMCSSVRIALTWKYRLLSEEWSATESTSSCKVSAKFGPTLEPTQFSRFPGSYFTSWERTFQDVTKFSNEAA